jgi:hypothetical protein
MGVMFTPSWLGVFAIVAFFGAWDILIRAVDQLMKEGYFK